MFELGSTLTDNSKKDKPWTQHKRNAVKVQNLYEDSVYGRYAERMEECGSWLEFAELEDSKKIKLVKAHFCRVRHCPVCSWRRTLALIARLHKNLPRYLAQYPDYAYLYLVFTVRNPEMGGLRGTILTLNAALKKLLKRKAVLPVVKGFVKTVEVTHGKDGNPHPHLNLLIAVNPSYFTSRDYIKKESWVKLWRECLGVDYDPSVYVTRVKPKGKREGEAPLVHGVKEVIKYSVKESDIADDKDFLIGITEQLYKLRFISTGGCLKDILKNDKSGNPDPEEVSSQEMISGDVEESDEEKGSFCQRYGWGYTDSKRGQYYLVGRFKREDDP